MSEPEKTAIQIVYAGAEDGFKDKKLHHTYFEIFEDGTLGKKALHFGKKLVPQQGRAGAILSCNRWEGEDSTRYGDFKVIGQWHDRGWVAAHQARDQAVKEARSEMRKRYEDGIKRQLEPLKTTYTLLAPRQRRAMLAMIIEYMTRLRSS